MFWIFIEFECLPGLGDSHLLDVLHTKEFETLEFLLKTPPKAPLLHTPHSDETLMRFVSIVTFHHFFFLSSFCSFDFRLISASRFFVSSPVFSSLLQCLFHLVIRWLLGKHGLRWWILWARLDGSAPDGKWVFPTTSLRSRLWWLSG